MTDFLDEKRREIDERLSELRPFVDEYSRLEAASAALAGVKGAAPAAPARTRTRSAGSRKTKARGTKAAPARRSARRASGARAGRRRGSGTRSAEALAFVAEQPGITIPELAAKMGIKQNYLYRVLPALEAENKVEKSGRGWLPKG